MSKMLKAVLAGAGLIALTGSMPASAVPLTPQELASKADSAVTEVRHRGGGHGGYRGGSGYAFRGPIYAGPVYRGPVVRHYYRPPVVFYSAPVVSYGYGSYGNHCAWLRHQAHVTGSPYWWRRYRYEC